MNYWLFFPFAIAGIFLTWTAMFMSGDQFLTMSVPGLALVILGFVLGRKY